MRTLCLAATNLCVVDGRGDGKDVVKRDLTGMGVAVESWYSMRMHRQGGCGTLIKNFSVVNKFFVVVKNTRHFNTHNK